MFNLNSPIVQDMMKKDPKLAEMISVGNMGYNGSKPTLTSYDANGNVISERQIDVNDNGGQFNDSYYDPSNVNNDINRDNQQQYGYNNQYQNQGYNQPINSNNDIAYQNNPYSYRNEPEYIQCQQQAQAEMQYNQQQYGYNQGYNNYNQYPQQQYGYNQGYNYNQYPQQQYGYNQNYGYNNQYQQQGYGYNQYNNQQQYGYNQGYNQYPQQGYGYNQNYGYNNQNYYGNGMYNNYNNPYFAAKQREAMEAQMRQEREQQLSIRRLISKCVHKTMGDPLSDEELNQTWNLLYPEPIKMTEEMRKEQEELRKYNQLVELSLHPTGNIILANQRAASARVTEEYRKMVPEDMGLFDFCQNGWKILQKIEEDKRKRRERDLSKQYDHDSYSRLIQRKSQEQGGGYLSRMLTPKMQELGMSINENGTLEVTLPEHLKANLEERKAKFMESIYNYDIK